MPIALASLNKKLQISLGFIYEESIKQFDYYMLKNEMNFTCLLEQQKMHYLKKNNQLKNLGIQYFCKIRVHELKPRDVERRFCMPEMLLERHEKKSFLHRIVTGDEKWIHYDNPKRKKSYVKPGQPAKQRQSRISMARR